MTIPPRIVSLEAKQVVSPDFTTVFQRLNLWKNVSMPVVADDTDCPSAKTIYELGTSPERLFVPPPSSFNGYM